MPVYHKGDAENAQIWVPTESNRDPAIFLVFLGTVCVTMVPKLIDVAGLQGPPYSYAGIVGFVLMGIGVLVLRFSRKRYQVTPKSVTIRDGMGSPVRYRWEGQPAIRLRAQEEERSGKTVEYWLVNLVDGKRQYVLDRRAGHQMESRSLAEALAKAINCSVIERTDSGEMEIKRDELDLPFRERARTHPNLLGAEVSQPENATVTVEEEGGKVHYRWRLMSPAMAGELTTLLFILVLLALVPIFPGLPPAEHPDQPGEKFSRSYFDLARQEQKYAYFLVTGTFLGLVSFYLFGYSKEITAAPERLSACDRLWGVPVWKANIPSDKLEEIWVRQSSRGAHIQFISDDCIITGRTSSIQMASWVASRIRRFYAS